MGTLPDFRTFPPDDLLGLFTCQRGYLQGYKTSKIPSVAICGRSCHIMPVVHPVANFLIPNQLGSFGKHSAMLQSLPEEYSLTCFTTFVTPTYMRIFSRHSCMHAYMHICMHTRTHMRTPAHTHTYIAE